MRKVQTLKDVFTFPHSKAPNSAISPDILFLLRCLTHSINSHVTAIQTYFQNQIA